MVKKASADEGEEDLVEVFTPFVRLRNGKVIWAWHYGLKVFHFWAKRRK